MKHLPKNSKKPALTIIELIVAMSLFAILATMGVILLSNVSKMSREAEMEEYLFTETQAVIERISKTIQDSAIDYEEYNSRLLEQTIDPSIDSYAGNSTYGDNYGSYHAKFFSGTSEIGINPSSASETDAEANAFCGGTLTCSDTIDYHETTELYLIDKTGTERTFFVTEDDSDGNKAIAMVIMEGTDTDANGLIDTWACATEPIFTCTGVDNHPLATDRNDLNRDNDDFVPLTPSNINIEELYFYISPLEDPYKGFAEDSSAVIESVQVQPKVTIMIKATYVADNVLGETPEVTLQTTIGTGVYNKTSTANSD
ncbi:type II secretion system protein [Candidatus Peregrinibacteria bacterium]|jgi:type II secretory pathway pseudopilin PulG|nr:type II secretion system protein [Candidatus Peregrinibacteria bacterium]MBT7483619.1 type II secretion system protein [Candidatus Peregrinibacteria bacterium]MBT7702887.1 type II secretion system protein [Candidatus Peregrinibacteria bacterium]